MRRTKIICTIGPASESAEMIEMAEKAGMNIARLNFSHGDHTDHLNRIKRIQELNSKIDVPIGILLDTQGPEIRLGVFKEKAMLRGGSEVTLTTRDVTCNEKIISISYKKLAKSVKQGSLVYVADGTIELKVKKVSGTEILCEVVIGGEVNTRKNVNLPGAKIDLPAISKKDIGDITFGAKHKIDFVAQSFVRTPKDILGMKKFLKKINSDASVIAKIESSQSLHNIDEIIKVSDGVMVARGDLGVQIPIEKVANAQKLIIAKCNEAGKPVIVATQMLESMTKNPRPTRAEVTDVANAIMDGSDAIMLSGETAVGDYPIRSIEMMDMIARETERKMDFAGLLKTHGKIKINDAIARSVCQTAYDLHASAIITCTLSGYTARIISKYRPTTPIIAVTPSEREVRKLNLYWGVHPLLITTPTNTDELIEHSCKIVADMKLVKKGDIVVMTAGIPFGIPGKTNFMKVDVIE